VTGDCNNEVTDGCDCENEVNCGCENEVTGGCDCENEVNCGCENEVTADCENEVTDGCDCENEVTADCENEVTGGCDCENEVTGGCDCENEVTGGCNCGSEIEGNGVNCKCENGASFFCLHVARASETRYRKISISMEPLRRRPERVSMDSFFRRSRRRGRGAVSTPDSIRSTCRQCSDKTFLMTDKKTGILE